MFKYIFIYVCSFFCVIMNVNANDDRFIQDISHRSLFANADDLSIFPHVPFGSPEGSNIIYVDENSDALNISDNKCFLALDAQGDMYSAHLKYEYDKINLESPYEDWVKVSGVDVQLENSLLIPSYTKYISYFVASSNNVYAVQLKAGSGCSVIEHIHPILNENSVAYSSTSGMKWASSSNALWLASAFDGKLLQIDLSFTRALNKLEIDSSFDIARGELIDLSDQLLSLDDPKTITSIYYVDAWSTLYVGTPLALYSYKYLESEIVSSYHEWIGAIIDTAPLGFAFDTLHNALWLAESNSVHKQTEDGRWWRYGLSQGSPFISNITSVAVSTDCNFVWVGSDFGLARLDATASPTAISPPSATSVEREDVSSDPWKWLLFTGNRFFPDDFVSILVPGGSRNSMDSNVLITSSTGCTVLQSSAWTLSEKALSMDTMQYRHDRMGFIGQCSLDGYGNTSGFSIGCQDNDALWTSMHAMGEIYRYLVTGESEARARGWDAFESLELLNILPGVYPAFPARSACLESEIGIVGGCGPISADKAKNILSDSEIESDSEIVWFKSPVPGYEDFIWKSTTSSDSIDGYLAVLPMMYDHVAMTDAEKQRVYDLIDGLTGSIVDNDYYLIDPSTGEPTQWGFWNPSELNDDPERYGERGSDSLGILAYTVSAYSITGNEKYMKSFWDLAVGNNYLANVMNAKIDCPLEDNHSDNELLFMTYHTAFYALRRLETRLAEGSQDMSLVSLKNNVQEMVDALIPSVDRMWTIVGREKSPLWLGFYAGVCQRPASNSDISDAVWSLRHWSIDLIDWPVDNTHRYDINISPYYPRDPKPETPNLMESILPPQERVTKRWNSDPFEYGGGGGSSEEAPYIWRLPYYVMLYYNLI